MAGGMGKRILLTGGSGSIGTALGVALTQRGLDFTVLDVRASGARRGDVRDAAAVRRAMDGCSGVVHLAAISRVSWAERAPDECRAVNVTGTGNILSAAREMRQKPWVLLASSREIYGEPDALPVTEDAPPRPINAYGRSKAEAEALVQEASRAGLPTSIVRLSNVYGSPHDHPDRVVPTFVRAALEGRTLDVSGTQRAFDFTHIDDVVQGLCAVIERLDAGDSLPPLHLVTGASVTLGDLARAIVERAGSRSALRERPTARFDVSRFVGDPGRARAILGFEARISIGEGLDRVLGSPRVEPGAEVRAS